RADEGGRWRSREWLRSVREADERAWFARDDLRPFFAMVGRTAARSLYAGLKRSPGVGRLVQGLVQLGRGTADGGGGAVPVERRAVRAPAERPACPAVTLEVRSHVGDLAGAWDELVDGRPGPTPFLRSWWLDSVAADRTMVLAVRRDSAFVGGV